MSKLIVQQQLSSRLTDCVLTVETFYSLKPWKTATLRKFYMKDHREFLLNKEPNRLKAAGSRWSTPGHAPLRTLGTGWTCLLHFQRLCPSVLCTFNFFRHTLFKQAMNKWGHAINHTAETALSKLHCWAECPLQMKQCCWKLIWRDVYGSCTWASNIWFENLTAVAGTWWYMKPTAKSKYISL